MNELALTTWLQRVRAWLELMEQRATGKQLSWAAEQAWGDSHDVIPISELEALAAEGDTSWVPAVMLSSAERTDTETTAFNPANQTIVANSDWAVTASMAEIEERLTSALADYLYQKTTSNSASSEQRENFAAAALDNSAQITTNIAEAGSLAEAIGQKPLKLKHLAYIGNHGETTTERYGSTSDAAYVPWRNPESKDNGYISKLTHSGELQWRKQIADVTNIITATDDDENVYTAWSRSKDYTPESRGSFIGKLNPDNGELLWTTKLDTHNYIIQDLHAVGETLYGVGHYKDTQRPVLLAVNRTDGKLLWLKEEPASDSEQFTDIQSDGTHLYISSTSRNKIAGTIHKYTLDGDVADQWQGSDRPDLKRTGTQDRYSVIVGDQLISVGTTGAEMPKHYVQWRLVSRNLETGEINWRKQWGGLGTKNIDGIIAFKGKIYIQTRRGSEWARNNGVIQEVSLDGELGRQLFYEFAWRSASHLSSDGERLYLVSGKIDRADKNSVAHLTTSANYQNDAYDEIGINQSFEIKGRAKDNYGSELSGYLTPKEDGEYVFYLSSDDHAELWLSTDDSKQNLQLITKRDHSNDFRDYRHAHSESIQLKAGQRYAIKALHKEGIGASHLSVAWRPASEPAPAKGAEPIGSDYLSYDLGDNNNTDIEQSQGQGLVAKYYDNVKGLNAAYQQIITGNETIDSTDNIDKTGNTAPTIELKGAQTITINRHSDWFDPGWAASDAEDGDELNVSVTAPKPIDTSVPGTYEITYTVEDSGGLQNSATRTLEVLAPREGNDYYLALDGSDENDGSIDQPFATFNHAKNFLQAGDTLHLRGGWYYEQFYIDGRENRNLWKWNDYHNPVTIKAYEGETVVLSEAPPISTTWVKDGNRWKTNVWEGSDDLGNNKRNISRLFLDDKLLTGARYPNLEKDWDQPGHNWFHTRVRTTPNPEAGEGVLTVPGLEDVDGSIKGAVFYSYWRGARKVLEHEAGSANITASPAADDGWLMGALPLLDADREWFFDKETGDLYLQLPEGVDPNEQIIRARTDLHGIGRMDGGLAVTNGGALVFDGINLFATPFTFNASRNITFKNAKLLHNDYNDYHLGGTLMGHGNFIWSSHGLRFINNEIAYNYQPAFNMGKRGDERGGWWPSNILFENNYMHDGQLYNSHNGGPFSWRTGNMTAVRNTLDNYGFGGLGRIAGDSHLELNYVNNSNYGWDTAGIQMNQIISGVNVQRNWIFNTKRNGIRSDGHPGGTGKIVTHNVVMGNGTGIKLKGDQHKVHHNLGFLNGADIGMWHAKFYGYTRATDSTIQDLVEAEKYQNNAYDNIKVTEGFEIKNYGRTLWGGELSGFLTPKQDGDYVFYLAADDEAELWLSTDDKTENLALIADRRQKSGYRRYTAGWDDSETLDQPGRSLSISLKAGQRYAIKALVRDGVESYQNQRSNHLSVAWRFDNEAAPVDGAEPIANEYLSYDLGNDRNHTLPIRGDGLTAKYYHDVFDTYIPSRSNATESRLWGGERQGNYLSVAHNNAINGGFGGYPIQDPEDRSNISTRGSRQTDIRDELRDVNNLDFRPKSGSSLIDSGIEIEGIHTPIAGITDGVVGSAADAGAYEYGDSHYWIAGHQTDKARFPIGATDQSTTAQPDLDLIWMEGLDSVSNLVYFGEDPEQLEFKVEQDGNIFDPTPEDGELLEAGKTYYWRIDTRTQDDTIIEGDTWSFTVDNRVKSVDIEAVLVDYQPDDYARAYRKNFGGVTKEELPAPKYDYYISKYEITNSQYAAFLNDTVGHNTNDGGAWSSSMQIKREASPGGLGGFIYTPIEGKENHPVTYVTWNNAALFTNWLSGDAGAIYGYLGSNKYYNSRYNRPSNASAWGHGAVSLPKLEEFYKASIYNRETNTLERYSTGGNSITLDQANFKGEGDLGVGETTEVGSYPYPSYFGTYDQTGNVDEWTDHRSHKLGGSYLSTTTDNTLGYRSNLSGSWQHRFPNRGFRVVSRTANERDKDNNGQSEFYITKFEDQDNRAPQFNNPIGNLDDEELEQADQLLNSEDDTWRLKSATLYQPYSFNIRDSVIEPQGYNFRFQLLEGPKWLKLSEDGEFTGTPTEEEHLGRFNIRYRVESDSNLFSTTTEPIELVVEPAVDASTGDDEIQTTFGSSVVFALAGDDVVQGSEQDEIFDGGRGDDTIDGGEGQDIAKYSGKQSDYSLKILENGAVEIKDLREILLDPKEIPTVEQLKSSDKYQNNAFDEAKIVNQFEFQNYGDDYGAEFSGYLTPKEDGFYIFYISGNEHAELWLSTDAEKENLELIAKRNKLSDFRRYTHQSGDYSGRSHVVELKADERYAIKALMTEETGGDHLSVTWGLATDPAPSHGAEPIAAEFLSYDLGDEVIADIPQSQGEGLVIKYFKNLRERHNPDGVDQLRNIEHLEFADGIQPIADVIALANAEPLSHEFVSSFGTSSNEDTGPYFKPSATQDLIILPWNNKINTNSGDRATIRAINFEGELAWEKQLSDRSQITTATDSAGHIYAAWNRPAKPWMIGKFDANGDLLWEKELEQNNHTVESMVVNGDTIYTAGTGGSSGLIYSINAVDGSINWTETQSDYNSAFNDILTDGDALYVVGSGQGNPPNRWGDSNSHSHAYKYDFDGNQIWASKWHPKTTPNHVSRSRWAREYSATIFENQLISVGTAYVNNPDTNWLNYPVSRDLETGEILWHKELRDIDNTWKSGLNHDIVSHNGFAYIISNNGSQTTIFEMEKDGSLGRQLTLDSTHANNFVVANNELHLFGRTSLNTGVAENQGGDDLFLAKIDPGFKNLEVPFSGISIIPTAPRDSEGNLQTSEDGSSTSFKVKLNQAPLTDEDVVVTLTGLDSTEGQLSTNKITFNRSNWDLGQDVVVTGAADNVYDNDTIYTIKATVSKSGGYQGTESATIKVKNINIDGDITSPSISLASNVSSLSAGETATLTFTLSEASTDFTGSDITVSGGSLSNWTAVSSTVYTATYTPDASSDTNEVISIASGVFSDAAGNTNVDGSDSNNSVTLTVDTVSAPPFTRLGNDIDGEAAGDKSGAVALSSDGTILAIGAQYNDGGGNRRGRTRIYAWNSGASRWDQRGNDINGEWDTDYSGSAVSISDDGSVVAIGAISNNGGGNGNESGHTRIFAWDGSDWVQRGSDLDGEASNDNSGGAVSLSSDGSVVAIGAKYNNNASGENAGQTRVYAWNGTAWVQRGSDIDGETAQDLSGCSVSLSGDGNTLAIGAQQNGGGGKKSGHTRVYTWDGKAWVQRGSDINGESGGDQSGLSVSLSTDGNVVAIGAKYNDNTTGEDAGHTRIYDWDGKAWVKRGDDIDGESPGDRSGGKVSLSGDGNVVAIGAPQNDANGTNSGHTRIYQWDGTAWNHIGSDIDGEAADDNSGAKLSLSRDGSTVAIGALLNDDNGSNAGHVRVFSLPTDANNDGFVDGKDQYILFNDGDTLEIKDKKIRPDRPPLPDTGTPSKPFPQEITSKSSSKEPTLNTQANS